MRTKSILNLFLFGTAMITLINCGTNKKEDQLAMTPEDRLLLGQEFIKTGIEISSINLLENGFSMLDSLIILYPNANESKTADSILQKRDSLSSAVKEDFKNGITHLNQVEPTFKDDEITATIAIESNGIRITNKSSNTYTGVRLKLNEKYKVDNLTLSGKEEKTIYYTDFTDDGERFNIMSTKPETIYIAGEYNGEKYWGYFKVN